jgi:hypothetical protein
MTPLEAPPSSGLIDLACALRLSDPSCVLGGAAAVFHSIASISCAVTTEPQKMLIEALTTPDAPWWVILLMQFALRELADRWRARPRPHQGDQAPRPPEA